MKNPIAYILVITFIIYACISNEKLELTVVNQSGVEVDSLMIWPNSVDERLISLKNGASIQYTLDLKDVEGDGAYRIAYRESKSGMWKKDTFGYFTNGAPLERRISYILRPTGE